jgi:hypothetical protein
MRSLGAIVLAVAVLAGCAAPSTNGAAEAAARTSFPPPGEARVWIYRTYDPYVTMQTPYVRINGAIVGTAWLGSAFYRDVAPGDYLITADSRGSAPNQFAHIGLAAGQTVYVKVDANNWWAGMCWRCQINTFFTQVVTPHLAQLEMAGLSPSGGG